MENTNKTSTEFQKRRTKFQLSNGYDSWQIRCEDWKSRTWHLLSNQKLSDCKFLAYSDKHESAEIEIMAHKLILAASSPVFEKMFYGNLAEKGDIKISDIRADIFKMFLNYIYTDELEIESENDAYDLYYVGTKYLMPFMVDKCVLYLLSKLNTSNVCRIFEFGCLKSNLRVITTSMELIQKQTASILDKPNFLDVQLEPTIFTMLDQDYLTASEEELFNYLIRYAKHHDLFKLEGDQEMKEHMMEALNKIRLTKQKKQKFINALEKGIQSQIDSMIIKTHTNDGYNDSYHRNHQKHQVAYRGNSEMPLKLRFP